MVGLYQYVGVPHFDDSHVYSYHTTPLEESDSNQSMASVDIDISKMVSQQTCFLLPYMLFFNGAQLACQPKHNASSTIL